MSDLRLAWDNSKGRADLVLLANGTLDSTRDLETMVIVSLFTDRHADPSDHVPGGPGTDRRGWWGDMFGAAGDRIGSRLWLLAVMTDKTPLIAQGYCLEALHWLVEDGIASKIDVQCWADPLNPRQLDILVSVTRGDGSNIELRFDNIWQAELNS